MFDQQNWSRKNQLPKLKLPLISVRKMSPSPSHKHNQIEKGSDFIRNMKRAQSIMIAHKHRKQKYVMKSFVHENSRNKQVKQREKLKTEPSPLNSAQRNNRNIITIPLHLQLYSQKGTQLQNEIIQQNPEKIQDMEKNSFLIKKTRLRRKQRRLQQKQQILKQTQGWKLGRWEVDQQILE